MQKLKTVEVVYTQYNLIKEIKKLTNWTLLLIQKK